MQIVKRKSVAVGRINKTKRGYGVYFQDTSVRLDMETFKEVQQRAGEKGISFGAEIRDLVEMGLETMKAEGL